MAAPRKISDAHMQLLRQIAQVRRTLPSDKQLARMTGLSVQTIKNYLSVLGKQQSAA